MNSRNSSRSEPRMVAELLDTEAMDAGDGGPESERSAWSRLKSSTRAPAHDEPASGVSVGVLVCVVVGGTAVLVAVLVEVLTGVFVGVLVLVDVGGAGVFVGVLVCVAVGGTGVLVGVLV